MGGKVLSAKQIEQFVEEGFVRVPEVFSRETASAAREFLWQRIGLSPDDANGWTQPVLHLKENYAEAPFADAFTEKFRALCDDAVGENRWEPVGALGWWPVTFPGFDKKPWQALENGWHVDGEGFHHHVNSREQGLLPVFLFSDVAPGDGGTAVSVGSHKVTARILAQAEPEGLSPLELAQRVAAQPREQIVEGVGLAGDVLLMHPFMLHTRSKNTGSAVRFLCNPCVSLHEPMNLQRADASEYSPVERAIVEAIQTA